MDEEIDTNNTDPEYWDTILEKTEWCSLDTEIDDTSERTIDLLEWEIDIQDIKNDIKLQTDTYWEIKFIYGKNIIWVIEYQRNEHQLYIDFIWNLNMKEADYSLYNVWKRYWCILWSEEWIRINGLIIYMYSELISYMKSLNMTEFAWEIDNTRNIIHAKQLKERGIISEYEIIYNEEWREVLVEKI